MTPLRKKLLWILIPVLVLILAGCIAFIGYNDWLDAQIKFHDVTIELGEETVSIEQFTTEFADPSKVSFASDVSVIDLNTPGTYPLTMQHGSQQENVTLTVQDTVAPTATFLEKMEVSSDYVPKAEDFVTDVFDIAPTTVSFATEPDIQPGYGDLHLTVVVSDGTNSVQKDCTVVYSWLKESITLEYGQTLKKQDLLLNPKLDDALLDQAQLDEINASPPGTYTLTSTTEAKTQVCTVTVQDTTAPELTLKEVRIRPGKTKTMEDFIVSYSDVSGQVALQMLSQPDFKTVGHQTITIQASDASGNVNKQDTLLIVTNDMTPPTISGISKTLTVEKHATPDFLEGVTATDKVDGECAVTVDTSELDLTQAGTYEITYSAMDNSHNLRTAKRKVTVLRNEEDTKLLVQQIAATVSNDPEKMRNYVRSRIYYNHSWGGDDPVYYGFTKRGGNCYVHAVCLKALLDEKGWENQLIWTTKKTHYWLIVKIDGVWKHIDPTPGSQHSKYSLMNDKQRLSTLSGRKWDFDAWPACE